jgi:hypothetical protein
MRWPKGKRIRLNWKRISNLLGEISVGQKQPQLLPANSRGAAFHNRTRDA